MPHRVVRRTSNCRTWEKSRPRRRLELRLAGSMPYTLVLYNCCRAMASALDSGVGEILSTLKATEVYDKSIIVFSSDNGA